MSPFRARWDEARVALSLLTRLPCGPLPQSLIPTGQTAWAFPLVGLLIGGATGLVFLAAALVLPPLLAAFLSVLGGVLLTGGLHEDGLADVADGFGGGLTRETRLEIMRDSRVGTYGVLALVISIGIIAGAMANLSISTATLGYFLAVGAASRGAMLLPMALLSPARSEGLGQGAALPLGWPLGLGLGIGLAIALLVLPVLIAGIVASSLLMLWAAKRLIGGQTGDVLGATQKLAEVTAWVLVAAYVSAS